MSNTAQTESLSPSTVDTAKLVDQTVIHVDCTVMRPQKANATFCRVIWHFRKTHRLVRLRRSVKTITCELLVKLSEMKAYHSYFGATA